VKDIVYRIWCGMHYSEHYGSHPGTLPLVLFVLLGYAVGGFGGMAIAMAGLLPLYLLGAYARGTDLAPDHLERRVNTPIGGPSTPAGDNE